MPDQHMKDGASSCSSPRVLTVGAVALLIVTAALIACAYLTADNEGSTELSTNADVPVELFLMPEAQETQKELPPVLELLDDMIQAPVAKGPFAQQLVAYVDAPGHGPYDRMMRLWDYYCPVANDHRVFDAGMSDAERMMNPDWGFVQSMQVSAEYLYDRISEDIPLSDETASPVHEGARMTFDEASTSACRVR